MRRTLSVLCLAALLASPTALLAQQGRGRGAGPAQAQTPKAAAPIDLTGYWVAVVTEDWRYRMVTPARGDYQGVPMTPAALTIADAWDPAKEQASGELCKSYGAPAILRVPGRLHITWQDDNTLKVEFDAGTQTRLLQFGAKPARIGAPTWQGYSAAEWKPAGQQGTVDRNNTPNGPSPAGAGLGPRNPASAAPSHGGSLFVTTTNFREGYLRKNGVPYSANATITEYFDKVGPEPNGDIILLVRTVVEDPKYLQLPFITSTHFKLESDGSKWSPSPCTAR